MTVSITQVLMALVFAPTVALPFWRWYTPVPFVVAFLTMPAHAAVQSWFLPDRFGAASAVVPAVDLGLTWMAVGAFHLLAARLWPGRDGELDRVPGNVCLGLGGVTPCSVQAPFFRHGVNAPSPNLMARLLSAI